MPDAFVRDSLPGGTSRLSTPRCTFTFRPEGRTVLLVTIAGHDTGAFGAAVFEEIRVHLGGHHRLDLFVDATDAVGPPTAVSEAWTRFFSREAPHLRRVRVLAPSRLVHLSVSVAKLFSRTGELVQVYADPVAFRAALERARGGAR
jgi:hypothetical protein